jgi:hypothetical protein
MVKVGAPARTKPTLLKNVHFPILLLVNQLTLLAPVEPSKKIGF